MLLTALKNFECPESKIKTADNQYGYEDTSFRIVFDAGDY